jgi:hypothetical protein
MLFDNRSVKHNCYLHRPGLSWQDRLNTEIQYKQELKSRVSQQLETDMAKFKEMEREAAALISKARHANSKLMVRGWMDGGAQIDAPPAYFQPAAALHIQLLQYQGQWCSSLELQSAGRPRESCLALLHIQRYWSRILSNVICAEHACNLCRARQLKQHYKKLVGSLPLCQPRSSSEARNQRTAAKPMAATVPPQAAA